MSGFVVAVVLFAALLHAGWNALVKAGREPFLTSVLVASGGAAISVVVLPFLTQPDAGSWPFVLASTCIHFFYYGLLAAAYRHGDMSHAYPLMRGSAPMLVAMLSVPLLGERLTTQQYAAVATISAGIFGLWFAAPAMALPHSADVMTHSRRRRSTVYALLNALAIAAYTLVDGIGVRKSGSPAAYTMWLFALSASGLLVWTLARRPRELAAYALAHWRVAALGGIGTLASYGLALWAMTAAPVAAVAALRETAILFAAAIAALFLREKIGVRRGTAIALIAAGAALMRYA
jgi:drug/metabolite transporter (DMT)-like permease